MLGLMDSVLDRQLKFLWEQLADLFLYSYENEFLDKLIKEGKRILARKFISHIVILMTLSLQ